MSKSEVNTLQNLSGKKRRLFRIIALSIPIIFFALLEICLSLFNYGPNLLLFSTETINGKSYYTLNPSVKNRYFNRVNFTPDPSPEYFLASKPPGTFRVFCLGGSTTVGYPYWYNGAFSSFLRDRLRMIFPDRSFEVVNLGMTATNSYTVLDIGKDIIKLEPDLIIVYDGHNEFYGALGVASNSRVAPARWMTLLYLQLVHFRTFQLVKSFSETIMGLFGKPQMENVSRATLMEQVAGGKNVPYGSDMYNKAFDIFRRNMEDLADLCKSRKIPLIISTQASNLRDQFPFISSNSTALSEHNRIRFQSDYKSGIEFQSRNMLDSAIVKFRSSIALDSSYADAHYRLAQCLDAMGKKHDAFRQYILSRDYDELRFRTDSKFNDLIRSMNDQENCSVADIEAVFESTTKDSLIGNNLFFEHLHPFSRGQFLMAKEYARLIRDKSILCSYGEWTKCDTIKDDFFWEQRHVTQIDELLAARKTEFLISRWPFRNPPSDVSPVTPSDTLKFIADEAAHGKIGWETAHIGAADFYLKRGNYRNAESEFETIINQIPFNVAAYLRLAQLYYSRKDYSLAEKTLLASLQIEQTSFANRALGDVYLNLKNPSKAIYYYEQLSKYRGSDAESAENAYMLALAYVLSGRPESAVRLLEQTINRYPNYPPAKELLAKIRAFEKSHPAR